MKTYRLYRNTRDGLRAWIADNASVRFLQAHMRRESTIGQIFGYRGSPRRTRAIAEKVAAYRLKQRASSVAERMRSDERRSGY